MDWMPCVIFPEFVAPLSASQFLADCFHALASRVVMLSCSETALQIWTRDEMRQFQRTSAALQFCHRDCAEVNQSKEVGKRELGGPEHLSSEDIRD
jgi:hypothetical protein